MAYWQILGFWSVSSNQSRHLKKTVEDSILSLFKRKKCNILIEMKLFSVSLFCVFVLKASHFLYPNIFWFLIALLHKMLIAVLCSCAFYVTVYIEFFFTGIWSAWVIPVLVTDAMALWFLIQHCIHKIPLPLSLFSSFSMSHFLQYMFLFVTVNVIGYIRSKWEMSAGIENKQCLIKKKWINLVMSPPVITQVNILLSVWINGLVYVTNFF